MVETMQFGDYLFAHNPHSITVEAAGEVAVQFCPGVGEVTQHLGQRGRVVTARGCFFGDSYAQALAGLQALQRTAGDGARRMLLVPGMAPFSAHLVRLRFAQEGDGRILPYELVFREAGR